MRKRRLERAIVLGLILSTSIYGTSFAANGTVPPDIQDLRNQAEQSADRIVRINEDTTIKGSYKYEYASTDDENFNTLKGLEIQVAEGKKFEINGVIMNSPNITGKGDIVINVGEPLPSGEKYQTAGIYVNGKIEGNSLTINNKDYEDSGYGKGIYAYGSTVLNNFNNGNITVDVDNAATINSFSDGIFTTSDKETSVYVNAGQITVDTTTRNGVYVGGPTKEDSYKNTITLTSEKGDISITSGGTDTDEASVKNIAQNGFLNLNSAKNITIDSAGQGIYTTAGTTTLTTQNGGNINISADKSAVYNHGGEITISAKKPVSGMSTFANYDNTDGYNNTLTGEENGIKSDSTGSTTVEADNDNIIAGNTNGILSNDAGTINVTAGNNNTIGQYTDDESKTAYTSEIGINAIEGTVTVTAEKGQNSIYGEKYGIRAGDEDLIGKLESSIKVEATKGNNVINVKGFYDSNGFDKDSGDGINVTANSTGTIELKADNGKNEINAIDDGIYVDTNSTKKVTLTAENNTITAGNNGIDYRGLGDNDSTTAELEVTATGANIIKAGVSEVLGNAVGNGNSLEVDGVKYREDKNGDGIRIQGNGNVKVTAGTYNNIAVRDTGLYIHEDSANSKIDLIANGTNDSFGNIIYAQENGVQIDGKNEGNAINVIANNGGNSITAKENAVYNNGTGTIKISAKKPSTEISTLANYNNELIAGENGVKSDGTGSTIVEADNNNTIAGSTNGILSNDAGTINVTAGKNNIIGQYTDADGNTTHTSQNGINVSSGTVTVTAGNENNIYGIQNGILATGVDSKVVIKDADNTSANTNIKVNNEEQKMAYGIYAKDNSKIDVDTNKLYIETTGNGTSQSNTSTGIRVENNALEDSIDIEGKESITIKSKATQLGNDETLFSGGQAYGLYVQNATDVLLRSSGTVYITAESLRNLGAVGIDTGVDRDFTDDTVEKATNVAIEGKDIIIGAIATNGSAYGIQAAVKDNAKKKQENTLNITGDNNIRIFSKVTLDEGNNNDNNNNIAIDSSRSNVNVKSNNGSIILVADSEGYVRDEDGKIVTTVATGVHSSSISDDYPDSLVSLNSKINNEIYSDCYGAKADGLNAGIELIAQDGNNIIYSNYDESASKGIVSSDGGTIILKAFNGKNDVRASNIGVYAANYVRPKESSSVTLLAKNNNIISNDFGIYTDDTARVGLNAQENTILVGKINEQGYGDGHAIKASGASNVDLNAIGGDNNISGVIYAKDAGTVVNLRHDLPQPMSETGAGSTSIENNIILSSAHGSSDDIGDRTKVVAALYAQNNGVINVTAGQGGANYIATDATLTDDEDREQTVWAQQGGKITIDGPTTIIASNANKNTDNVVTNTEQDGNSLGIAITAGTGTVTTKDDAGDVVIVDAFDTDNNNALDVIEDDARSTVNLNYETNGNFITGDIVSGYGGLINIQRKDGVSGNVNIEGNALAANGGKLNIDLGNGGTWTGRADDYGDAGYGPDAQNHQNFYNPAFSNTILEGGTVNLTMGDNSTWFVNGQSWITSVDTTNAQNATIDLIAANTDRNTTSHALTIYDLKGNANINMSLDRDRDVSDMLYVKNAQGEYNVALADAVTTADMYANGFDGLRFATVGAGSNVRFNAGSYDAGVFNVEYEVGTDAYDGNSENSAYNGDSLDVEKPGTSTVDSFFGYSGGDPNTEESKSNADENTSQIATYARMAKAPEVMTLAEEPATETTETTAATKDATTTGATNYKLIARKGESLSDAGNTILNMSKANYSQAVYLDTLNKRLGEARYLEGDEGLWVRMRHDKIDKDSSYEITNNMYELGYDKKYESKDKNGYHRKGVAIDYMDGDTSYDDIAGSGETNRKGIWLYDTWFGNKGHYTDYVLKWGHLENSFDLYTKTRGEKVSGDYDNDVYSLSAEWGYKDPLKNGWYFEPQAQLQYARVTGADYETSQGTQVSVDGIDSLIARAGFRLGKDFGEEKKSTFYVKADILHEFLGDQDITVMDKTTDGKAVSIGYDNDGTWYSVGLGFSTMLSDNSYAFLDVEKIFGNDNDNSYQINGGFNWLL